MILAAGLNFDQALFTQFLLGGVSVCCAAVGAFFLRFYVRTRDRLLVIFAIAFWVLGLNWMALAFIQADEVRTWLYAVRFLAFLSILAGIIDKNRSPKRL
jgi:hypothetical protein